ncbi:MAG: GerAB/ArcD/ProY family transporter [Halanaerobiales bacterium]
MKEHGKLTERQFAGIIANTLIGAGTLVLPRTVTATAGTGAWISVLIGGFLSIVVMMIIIKLGLRFPEETLMEYGAHITNKWIGGIIGFIFCLYWIFLTGLVIRAFSSMLTSAVLLNTPIEMIIIAMILIIVYFTRHDIQVIGRINELYFVFIIIPILFGIFLALREINFIRLLPLTGGQGLLPLLRSGTNSFFSFLGFEIIILFIPSITTQKLSYNYGIKGIISPLIVYMILVLISVGVFGIEELQNLTWPTLELVKVTPFPGLVLERLEAVFIAFWVVAIFTTSGNLFYSSVIGLSQIFKIEEHKTLIFPLLPFVFFIAVYPDNIFEVLDYMDILGRAGGVIIFFIPVIYYLIAVIANKRGDERS